MNTSFEQCKMVRFGQKPSRRQFKEFKALAGQAYPEIPSEALDRRLVDLQELNHKGLIKMMNPLRPFRKARFILSSVRLLRGVRKQMKTPGSEKLNAFLWVKLPTGELADGFVNTLKRLPLPAFVEPRRAGDSDVIARISTKKPVS
jgi:hypothetical protein